MFVVGLDPWLEVEMRDHDLVMRNLGAPIGTIKNGRGKLLMEKKRNKIHIIDALEREIDPIEETSEDVGELVDEFIHELENVSPENSCERKAMRMVDCLKCIVNVIKWLIGLIIWENHHRKSRSRMKSE